MFLPRMTYQLTNYRNMAQGALAAYYATPPYSQQRISQRYRHAQGTRTYTQTKKRRLMFKNSFRKQMLKNTAAKHDTNALTTVMTHNTLYTFNATENIIQGDSNTDRDGDAINLEALKLRGTYNTPTAGGAYTVRIIVGFSGEEIATGSAWNSLTGLAAQQIFLPAGTSNLTSLINPKAFTMLYDEVVDLNSQIEGVRDVTSIIKTVIIGQKFDYQSAAGTFGKLKNLYVVIVANEVNGTAGVTSTGNFNLSTDCIFK